MAQDMTFDSGEFSRADLIRPFRTLSVNEIQEKYNDYAEEYHQWNWVNDYVFGVKRMRRRLLQAVEGRTLDVACGTGENFPFLENATDVTAVDISPGMLAFARDRAKSLGVNYDIRQMDAGVLAFDDDTFDTVVTAMSTCTFPDPILALREMRRVVKPNGHILMLEHGRSRVEFFGRYQDRTAHKHYEMVGCHWNQEPLELVQEAGLTIVNRRRAWLGVFTAIEARP